MSNLHPIFQQALSPFAPKASCVHDWRGVDTGRMCASCGLVERQYSGKTIEELYAVVDNTTELSKRSRDRKSSVDGKSGWKIIVAIQGHLCDRVMTKADVQAWQLLTDLQEQLLWGQPETECQAYIPHSATGEDADLCRRDVVLGTEFCEAHQEHAQ